ncbi:MAG: hypothetical protein AB7D36_05450 [Oscillospiraceae bacterium]
MTHYSGKNTIKNYFSYGGGANNQMSLSTNPDGNSIFAFTDKTVVTTGDSAKESNVIQRHQRKLKMVNNAEI